MTDPIVVRESAIPAGINTIIRYGLTALGGLLVSRGWFSEDALNDIIGALLVILPAAYGLYRTITNKKEAVIMATALPNDVAVLK